MFNPGISATRDSVAFHTLFHVVLHLIYNFCKSSWWHHQMGTFSALLALCARNSPVTGEFPSQRPMVWNFNVFFHLCLNKRLSKQSWGWRFETPSCSLWRHCNDGTELQTAMAISHGNSQWHITHKMWGKRVGDYVVFIIITEAWFCRFHRNLPAILIFSKDLATLN